MVPLLGAAETIAEASLGLTWPTYGKVRYVHGGAEAARTHLHEDGGGAQRCTRRRSSCLAWLSLMIHKSQSDKQRS